MGSMHERKPQADRWISAEQNADCHMETVEDREKTLWGTSKTRSTPVDGEAIAGFADHYQAAAKTTGLHLISKEILAKRGLLSCLDYYLN